MIKQYCGQETLVIIQT